MALLSRSSLRGSVRRHPDPADNDGQALMKQRTLHDLWPHRRQSSPDCLDTTTPDKNLGSGRARHANPPLKPTRPRLSSRRTRRRSSSVDSIASVHELATPGQPRINGNGAVKKLRGVPDRDIPAGGATSNFLRDARESPDPLDMISPVTTNPASRSRPDASALAADEAKPGTSPTVTRKTRRSDHEEKREAPSVVKTESNDAALDNLAGSESADATRAHRTLRADHTTLDASTPVLERPGSERRSLRSADTGARCKSELAQYFHNYEQIISLEDPKPGQSGISTHFT